MSTGQRAPPPDPLRPIEPSQTGVGQIPGKGDILTVGVSGLRLHGLKGKLAHTFNGNTFI